MRYLIVEGITDVSFVKYICYKNGITDKFNEFELKKSNLNIDENRAISIETYENIDKNLYIINASGQDNLEVILKEIIQPMQIKVDRVGIIQDADNDFDISLENIEKAINNTKVKIDKNRDIFLMPNHRDIGDLETLLLSTIKDNSIINCFDDYRKCLEETQEIHPKALNKGQVYAYTMYSQKGENLYKPQNSFMHKKKKKYKDTGLWDLEKDEFKPIIGFIIDIFTHSF